MKRRSTAKDDAVIRTTAAARAEKGKRHRHQRRSFATSEVEAVLSAFRSTRPGYSAVRDLLSTRR